MQSHSANETKNVQSASAQKPCPDTLKASRNLHSIAEALKAKNVLETEENLHFSEFSHEKVSARPCKQTEARRGEM
jgi:hypothetical protein